MRHLGGLKIENFEGIIRWKPLCWLGTKVAIFNTMMYETISMIECQGQKQRLNSGLGKTHAASLFSRMSIYGMESAISSKEIF